MTGSMTPAQIRGARGMLGWSMVDLAGAARVSVVAVRRMELEDMPAALIDLRLAVWDAFLSAGVRFLDDEGDGPGVRLGPP